MRQLEHLLVKKKIPIYMSLFEDMVKDEEVTKGKVVFSTFH